MNPYGNINTGRHYLRLVAWRHPAITWTNVYLSSVNSSDIHMTAIPLELPQPPIIRILNIDYLKFHISYSMSYQSPMDQWVISTIGVESIRPSTSIKSNAPPAKPATEHYRNNPGLNNSVIVAITQYGDKDSTMISLFSNVRQRIWLGHHTLFQDAVVFVMRSRVPFYNREKVSQHIARCMNK